MSVRTVCVCVWRCLWCIFFAVRLPHVSVCAAAGSEVVSHLRLESLRLSLPLFPVIQFREEREISGLRPSLRRLHDD